MEVHFERRKYWNVALIIIGINFAMFFLQQLFPTITDLLLLDSSKVSAEPWRFFTAMFLHADIWHILFNMYALLIFGTLIEQRIGSQRFIGIYLLSGFIANLGSFWLYPKALGASGAIMSILGLTIMLLPDLRVLFFFVIPMSMRTAGIIFALIDIIGLFAPSGIANLAHLIGLACGLVYGYYLIRLRNAAHAKLVVGSVLGNSAKSKSAGKGPSKFKRLKTEPKRNNIQKDSIEMSEEELEEYLRNGKL